MRIIRLDIHRAFAEAVAWDDGKLKRLGRVDMRRPLLEASQRSFRRRTWSWSKRPATQPRSLR
jgi:hypothetical protein